MISAQVENVTFMTSHICLVFFPRKSLLFLELLSQQKMLFQLVDLLEPVAPIDGMSRSSVYSTYEGSLTTPGCNEVKHIEKSNLQFFFFFSSEILLAGRGVDQLPHATEDLQSPAGPVQAAG